MTSERAATAFERYGARVQALAARVLLDPDEARDVAADAFLALLSKQGPARDRSLLAWLFRAAHNRAVDRIRARERQRRILGADHDRVELELDTPVARAQIRLLVEEAMSKLERRDREALELRYLREGQPDDVAAALGVTPENARVILHRASRRLRVRILAILADRHGASPSCASRLKRGRLSHDGCETCAAVADEVAVLTAGALIPLPLAAGVIRRFGPSMSRVRTGAGGRFAEALLALAMLSTVGVPAVPASVGPPIPTDRQPTTVEVHSTAQAEERPAKATASEENPPSDEVETVEKEDEPEDQIPEVTRAIDELLPITIPDAPDTSIDDAYDIRSMRIATTVAEDGTPNGVRIVWRLAASPQANEGFSAHWVFREGGWGNLGTSESDAREGTGWVTMSTSEWQQITEPGRASPAHARLDGTTLTFEIRFAELQPDEASRIHPGAILDHFYIYTTSHPDEPFAQNNDATEMDHAPDADAIEGDSLSYRIAG